MGGREGRVKDEQKCERWEKSVHVSRSKELWV